jgi:LCP family protein required for cell wall assembly
MNPKNVEQSLDGDSMSFDNRRERSVSPYTLLFPGLFQLSTGRRFIGFIALTLAIATSSLILIFAVLVFSDRDTMLNLLTNSSDLDILGVFIASFAFSSLALRAIDILELSRSRVRRMKRWITPIVASTAIHLIVALLTANLAFSQANLLRSLSAPATGLTTEGSNEIHQIDPLSGLDRVNVLLMGGDAGEGRVGLRPDSISILSIEVDSGQVTIIGIPRNLQNAVFSEGSPLYGPFPHGYNCGESCLISYLYTYGSNNPELYDSAEFVGRNPGVEATRDAVEGVTGLEMHYSVLIDMRSFQELVDSLGGVKVCVPVTTSTRDGSMTFLRGCQHMNGSQALAYSRIRSDSDDYNRMNKQRIVQTALLSSVNPLNLALGFQKIADLSGKFVKTDIPESGFRHLAKLALKAGNLQPQTLELVPPLVKVTEPDFKSIRQLIRERIEN